MLTRAEFLTSAAAALLSRGAASRDPVVTIPGLGGLRGVDMGDVTAFKGVPYAAPPVGALRWMPPQQVRAWGGVRPADRYGPSAPQVIPPQYRQVADGAYSEDCLYLNIWRPAGAEPQSRLPVMVWIHGGGFVFSSGANPVTDGANLARHGVIVVSINYRLGRFGWFAHPELTAEAKDGPTGNFGLMDQIAALRWVRDHIEAFGGDPANVTIFGVSAGARSVHMLMSAPPAQGLFAKAIAQTSGPRMRFRPLAEAEGYGRSLGNSLGAADLNALRTLDAETLLHAPAPPEEETAPLLDGRLVKADVDHAFELGLPAPVPHLLGTNDFEASNWESVIAAPQAVLDTLTPEVREAVVALYGDGSDAPDLTDIVAGMITDRICTEPARHVARYHARRGAPVFRYRFAYVPEALRDRLRGVGHAYEQPFVFDTLDAVKGWSGLKTENDSRTANMVGRYWTNFARTGDPNGGGLPTWPRDGADELLHFTAAGPRAEHQLLKQRLDFWRQAAAQA